MAHIDLGIALHAKGQLDGEAQRCLANSSATEGGSRGESSTLVTPGRSQEVAARAQFCGGHDQRRSSALTAVLFSSRETIVFAFRSIY
jgi:hypothetical protein